MRLEVLFPRIGPKLFGAVRAAEEFPIYGHTI